MPRALGCTWVELWSSRWRTEWPWTSFHSNSPHLDEAGDGAGGVWPPLVFGVNSLVRENCRAPESGSQGAVVRKLFEDPERQGRAVARSMEYGESSGVEAPGKREKSRTHTHSSAQTKVHDTARRRRRITVTGTHGYSQARNVEDPSPLSDCVAR